MSRNHNPSKRLNYIIAFHGFFRPRLLSMVPQEIYAAGTEIHLPDMYSIYDR
jgi:hypothetical protein